jgi:hypothetical protein
VSKGRTTLGGRLRQLHAMLGSKNAQERETALNAINVLLEKHRKTWNDLGELMAGASRDPLWNTVEDDGDEPQGGDITVLDMVLAVINAHIDVTEDEAFAIALWILLTHQYDKFEFSPRLALLSPIKGCGKTTVLKALKYLCARAALMNSITPATIYRLIDRDHPTLLIDEGDNLGLNINPTIRAIMNSGHDDVESKVGRTIKGEPKEFDTFGPLAIAAIGTLPLTLMDRSVIVHMEKSQRRDLRRLDPKSPNIEVVHGIYRELCKWAHAPLQAGIDDILPGDGTRHADNWRPLFRCRSSTSVATANAKPRAG